MSLAPGFCFTGFPLYSGRFQLQRPTRRNGPPGVNTCLSTHERRLRAWPIVVRGLCPVLRTRPTRPASLDFCSSPRACAEPCRSKATASPGPLPGTRLWYRYTLRHYLAGSGTCVKYRKHGTLRAPLRTRAVPGTHGDREEPHSSPLPHHRTYGSVYGDSADQSRHG